MYKNQDELSILQKQFEGAANQFPEMVYYTAMLSFEDYKTHGDLKRNVRFHGAENVSEVMKKHIDPWQVDLLGKEIHAWDNGRYVSPVVRDGPSNHYHWLVRPIGQSWDTLPAMQRIHTLTRQASIILKRLYGTIGGVSRASHRQSNYLSHWFMSMRDILICEKHEYSFIQEELEYLNKALHIALKTHDIELLQKLLSERPPTFDGISDVFLKSAFVCTILIDRLREKDINKPNVTDNGENINENIMSLYLELNLAKRTLVVGEITHNITSEKIWAFLKTLAYNRNQHQVTKIQDGDENWKNARDMLRRKIGRKVLKRMVLSSKGCYILDKSVVVKGGGQIGIR